MLNRRPLRLRSAPAAARRRALLRGALTITLLAPALPGQVLVPPPSDSALRVRVDEYMRRLEGLGYNGGVLIRRNGRTVFQRAYGWADRGSAIRADTSTVWNLGSITKQFTAAAILRLEEEHKLRTTDSIGRFFPEAPDDKRGITIHQLLTHTAGFRSDYTGSDYDPVTRAEYVNRMFAAPLLHPPGSAFEYANSGYSLLAAIIELTTGKEYEFALRELVLRPAGMLETGYRTPAWPMRRVAHGYQEQRDWGTIVQRLAVDGAPFWALRGNGGLHTTFADIARWDRVLTRRGVLTDSSLRKFMTGYVNEGPEGRSQYAYGWAVMKTSRNTRLVTHNGGNGIYVAELLRFTDERVTLFVTSTVNTLSASDAVRTISRIAFSQPYELPPARASLSPFELTAFAGTYPLADSSALSIRIEDGRVLAAAVGQQAFQVLATGDTAAIPGVAAMNQRALVIATATSHGDVGPLRAALGPGAPDSAEVTRQETQLVAYRWQTFGSLKSVETLGTLRMPDGALRTTVRLNYEHGAATNLYTWDASGHISDIGARPWQPLELTQSADGLLRSFDPRTGVGARFTADALGLTVQGAGAPLVLRRTP